VWQNAQRDPDTVASETRIYQAEGNLEQAGKLLAGVNAQTPSFLAFGMKMEQLSLERHFDDAVRSIHSRLTEYRDPSDIERLFTQFNLVLAQENAGDIAGARATYEENLAFVEVLVSDKHRAIPRLQRLLKIPYYNCLTPALLRLHPQWDHLRSDPAFEKLCEEKQK
jgi:hypothetical protein